MIRKNLSLIVFTLLIFGSAIAIAAIPFDSAPSNDDDNARNITRKNGDMIIFYSGRRGYYGRSHRTGSLGTRSYRGGGLRGGK